MESFDTFRFAEPDWALALWVVAFAVVLLLWLEQRGTRALDRLVSPALQARLVERPRRAQRVLRIILLGLSAVCLVLSLMQPQWGLRHVPVERSGAQIMIALDVSRSMLAEDVAPNRLARAKAEIVDLLEYLEGDQVGLIAFGGRATVLSPLTPDFGFLQLGLANAGPGSAGRGGTRLEEPLRKAIAGFAGTDRGESAGSSRALILITDGEDHGSFPLDAAKAAAEAGILVIAIGIGNEEGSEVRITNPRTGARERLRDADGEVVLSRLDGDLLRRIAEETGGVYVPAGTATLDLDSIYREYIGPMTRGQFDPRGRVVRDELYPAFVILGLLFLLGSVGVSSASSRTASRGVVVLLALSAVTPESWAQPAATSGPVPPELERAAPRVEEIFGEL
ncbi:MAG: VWA domain-containing protein, partial [Myxococcota bacterium]|nr:VWA domain-containing protein [Myxococcota bacterium]